MRGLNVNVTGERLSDAAPRDYRFLEEVRPELGPATSLVMDLHISKWGSEVTVSCLYDPMGSRKPYQVLFRDCHRLQWEIVAPEYVLDLEADVIGFEVEGNEQRAPSVISTDIFELAIWYGSYEVVKDW